MIDDVKIFHKFFLCINGHLNPNYSVDGVHITDYSMWKNVIEKYVMN